MKSLGKFIERSMWFFPITHLSVILYFTLKFIKNPQWTTGGIILFLVYLLPPLLYRLFSLIIPIHIGRQKFGPEHDPCGWMIAHRLQMIYMIFPFIEGILNSLPGLYSNWLRLWGSKIGKMVYWAPDVRVWDRTHLTVGSNTFVGGSLLSCHMATPKADGTIEINFNPIEIGSKVFISAQSNIGPGSAIVDKEFIKMMTQVSGRHRVHLIELRPDRTKKTSIKTYP